MQKPINNCPKEQNALLHFENTLKNPNFIPVMINFYQIVQTSTLELNINRYDKCKLSYRDISNEANLRRVCVLIKNINMTIIVIITRSQENATPFAKGTKVIFMSELKEMKGPQSHEDQIKRLKSSIHTCLRLTK